MPSHDDSIGSFISNTSTQFSDSDHSGIPGLLFDTSIEIRDLFHRHPKTRLQFLASLGSGAFGDVFSANLIFTRDDVPGVISLPCAVKRLKVNGAVVPEEFMLQQAVTKAEKHHSSAETGVLLMYGIYTETNNNGKKTHWGVYPKCNAMLASWLPAMSALKNTQPDLFCHIAQGVFDSFFRGLRTFNRYKIFYSDGKPLNTGHDNSGFVFLDLGGAQKYEDFLTSKKIL